MRKHVFVLIRYSVLSKNRSKNWIIGRKKFEEYRNELFQSDRLKARYELFAKITLPSLVNQSKAPSKDWLTVQILVSEEMPFENLQALKELVAPYDWISIVPVSVENTQLGASLMDELSCINDELCYASVRLDDDDALGHRYFENLFKYLDKPFSGFYISFGQGVAGIIKDDKFVDFKNYYYPKCAVGLALVLYKKMGDAPDKEFVYGTSISHTKIDQGFPLVVDSRSYGFMRTIHQHADTVADKRLESILRLPSLEKADVENVFPLDPSVMP